MVTLNQEVKQSITPEEKINDKKINEKTNDNDNKILSKIWVYRVYKVLNKLQMEKCCP